MLLERIDGGVAAGAVDALRAWLFRFPPPPRLTGASWGTACPTANVKRFTK